MLFFSGIYLYSDTIVSSSSVISPLPHAVDPDIFVPPRFLPIPVLSEVAGYSRDQGVLRQVDLLSLQDTWQNHLVSTQYTVQEKKSRYLQLKDELFLSASRRVETFLARFVDDMKYMQKTVKRELGELNSSERDLRNLFEESTSGATFRQRREAEDEEGDVVAPGKQGNS